MAQTSHIKSVSPISASEGIGPMSSDTDQGSPAAQLLEVMIKEEDKELITLSVEEIEAREREEKRRKYEMMKEFRCEVCSKYFHRSADLRRHSLSHSGMRPFVCSICGKGFAQKPHLATHALLHAERKPFPCPICDKGYTQRQKLDSHIKIVHEQSRPYVCSLCGKTFARPDTYKLHMKRHDGYRPFACHLCGRTFTQSYHYKNHMAIHTNTNPNICALCEKSFSDRGSLNRHRKKVHKLTRNAPTRSELEAAERLTAQLLAGTSDNVNGNTDTGNTPFVATGSEESLPSHLEGGLGDSSRSRLEMTDDSSGSNREAVIAPTGKGKKSADFLNTIIANSTSPLGGQRLSNNDLSPLASQRLAQNDLSPLASQRLAHNDLSSPGQRLANNDLSPLVIQRLTKNDLTDGTSRIENDGSEHLSLKRDKCSSSSIITEHLASRDSSHGNAAKRLRLKRSDPDCQVSEDGHLATDSSGVGDEVGNKTRTTSGQENSRGNVLERDGCEMSERKIGDDSEFELRSESDECDGEISSESQSRIRFESAELDASKIESRQITVCKNRLESSHILVTNMASDEAPNTELNCRTSSERINTRFRFKTEPVSLNTLSKGSGNTLLNSCVNAPLSASIDTSRSSVTSIKTSELPLNTSLSASVSTSRLPVDTSLLSSSANTPGVCLSGETRSVNASSSTNRSSENTPSQMSSNAPLSSSGYLTDEDSNQPLSYGTLKPMSAENGLEYEEEDNKALMADKDSLELVGNRQDLRENGSTLRENCLDLDGNSLDYDDEEENEEESSSGHGRDYYSYERVNYSGSTEEPAQYNSTLSDYLSQILATCRR